MEMQTHVDPSIRGVAEYARRAEEVGWDIVSIYDSQNITADTYVAMTLAVMATERIEISSGRDQPLDPAPGGHSRRSRQLAAVVGWANRAGNRAGGLGAGARRACAGLHQLFRKLPESAASLPERRERSIRRPDLWSRDGAPRGYPEAGRSTGRQPPHVARARRQEGAGGGCGVGAKGDRGRRQDMRTL